MTTCHDKKEVGGGGGHAIEDMGAFDWEIRI